MTVAAGGDGEGGAKSGRIQRGGKRKAGVEPGLPGHGRAASVDAAIGGDRTRRLKPIRRRRGRSPVRVVYAAERVPVGVEACLSGWVVWEPAGRPGRQIVVRRGWIGSKGTG